MRLFVGFDVPEASQAVREQATKVGHFKEFSRGRCRANQTTFDTGILYLPLTRTIENFYSFMLETFCYCTFQN